MNERSLYDEDIYAWSEQQAAVLRRLAEARPGLPIELDLEHVAEEIEDVGKSEKHAAESALRSILVHLIKLAAAPNAPATRHWRSEIVTFHIELLSRLTPAIANGIDLDQLWKQAKRQARANLDESEREDAETPLWALSRCPLDVDLLAGDEIDIDLALSRLSVDR